ncbi:plasmid mobilization protein [uncultured Draconibacterium sp.]|uniref:plasmid mobilization protein n=1 Tax=uncultured Draconibacterium sp. TaxID=1573823 RepID=UPI0029C74F96|nr:plasmid mobilization relaxosome protein MobC [uncultured Draconibacterium sp.]
MRPKLPEHEKRTEIIRLLLTKEEKKRLDSLVRTGKFGCRSDYIRYSIFRRSVKKEVRLDPETKDRLNNLDYELNRIGVNLNQLSKKMNSFSAYNVGDNDRQLLKQAFQMMMQCLAFLQKRLR